MQMSTIIGKCNNFNQTQSTMIESPIRRKNLHYPKDFLPSSARNTAQPKRFTFNQDYQIDANALKKYSQPFEQQQKVNLVTNSIPSIIPNPQKSLSKQIQFNQQRPLDQHSGPKRPDIDSQILKKPRFCVKNNEEIDESQEQINAIMSPGIIKHQLEGKQAPLPLEDPCRIDLLQSKSHIKVPNSYIMYRSTAGFEAKKWSSSEKDVLERFKESRIKKSMNQLPSVKKGQSISIGKQILQGFKKKQSSTGGALENVNNFLAALKKRQQKQEQQQPKVPKFQQKGLQRLKQDINYLAKAKRRVNFSNQFQPDRKRKQKESDDEQKYSSSQQTQKSYIKQTKNANKHSSKRSNLPQFMVSYRSSLSYLKDLYARTASLPSFKLTVKIPKLFTDDMIYKGQDRVELHQTAKSIFQELRIPNENLVIKRYTNCTMIIARNVCLIWHFDGRRYLGGWQTEYLDEGCKHGLGLQWCPKTYVYYGQFIQNKKDGLGVYKDRDQAIYVGYWKGGKKVQNHSQDDYEQQQEGQMGVYEDNGERYEYL